MDSLGMLFWQIPIWFNCRRFKNILPGRIALLAVFISTICAVYCTVPYCTVPYCTVLTVLYCTVLWYCTVLCCTVLYCTVLYCTILYCTVLYCTLLYCTVPYCTVLHCTLSVLSWTELYEKKVIVKSKSMFQITRNEKQNSEYKKQRKKNEARKT